jgi:hypothetical protein
MKTDKKQRFYSEKISKLLSQTASHLLFSKVFRPIFSSTLMEATFSDMALPTIRFRPNCSNPSFKHKFAASVA